MSTAVSPKHRVVALVADKTLDAVEVPAKSPGAGEVLIEVELASYGAGDDLRFINSGTQLERVKEAASWVARGPLSS